MTNNRTYWQFVHVLTGEILILCMIIITEVITTIRKNNASITFGKLKSGNLCIIIISNDPSKLTSTSRCRKYCFPSYIQLPHFSLSNIDYRFPNFISILHAQNNDNLYFLLGLVWEPLYVATCYEPIRTYSMCEDTNVFS